MTHVVQTLPSDVARRASVAAREILTVADDGMARLWDGRTGRLLRSPLPG